MRQFLKQTLASIIGTILGLGLVGFVTIGGLIALLIGLASTEKDSELAADNILTLDLSKDIRDAPLGGREALTDLLAGQSSDVVPLRVVLEGLEKAANDDRIQGVYISGRLAESEAGFAILREVRQALQAFREESGKPVIAYGVNWSERDYFVASAADEVILNPYGALEMNGFSAQGTFWAGALEKYGIGVQVVRAGKFKSAVEPFTQTERSAESREQLQTLLGSLWTDFLMAVGEDRSVDPKQLLAIARSQGIFRGDQANSAKLVDQVAYEDEILEKLADMAPSQEEETPFEGVSFTEYFEDVETAEFETAGADSVNEEVEDGEPSGTESPDGDPEAGRSPNSDESKAMAMAAKGKIIPVVQPGMAGQRKVWLNPPTPDDLQSGNLQSGNLQSGNLQEEPTDAVPSLTPEPESSESPAEAVDEKDVSEDDAGETIFDARPQVAVVYATGAIVGGKGTPNQIGGDALAETLRDLRQDDDVAAVVLRINSRGGSATASEIIAREVELISAEKPLVISMGDYAASGAYWISAPASEIVAEPTTITGSIGVFGLLPNVQQLGANNGVAWDAVQTGPLADLRTVTRPKSEAEMALLQSSVDWIYGEFINKVAEGRNLEPTAVNEIAQGRVWSGRAAKKLGLVDELGGLEVAIARAADLADLDDDWRLEEYPKPKGLGGIFPFDGASLDSAAELIIAAGARIGLWAWLSESRSAEQVALAHWSAWRSQFEWFATLDDPNGAYAKSFEAWEIR
ncbi:MAG: signal peptide peptidase SppA [Cyanobacteria bacterium P01_C01_bin.89]